MNRTMAGFAMLLLLLTASPVWAEDAADDESFPWSDRHFYLAGGIGVGGYMELKDELEPLDVDVQETVGVDLRAGYRVHRNVAAELQFQWFSESNVRRDNQNPPPSQFTVLKVETWTFTANLKGYILTDRIEEALDGRFAPYLLAGVGVMHFDANDKADLGVSSEGEGLVGRFGGGIDVYPTPNIGFYLDVTYLVTTGDVDSLDHLGLSLGAVVRF